MRLSENFNLEEFAFSKVAIKNGINNKPGRREKENLKTIAKKILEPLQKEIKAPITILSGFRSYELNSLVEGKKESQHLRGEAVDIVVYSKNMKEVFELLAEKYDYDQLIYSHNKWIHVSYCEGCNRHTTWISRKRYGRTIFEPFKGN